jgi:hypothetical protein
MATAAAPRSAGPAHPQRLARRFAADALTAYLAGHGVDLALRILEDQAGVALYSEIKVAEVQRELRALIVQLQEM